MLNELNYRVCLSDDQFFLVRKTSLFIQEYIYVDAPRLRALISDSA